MGKKYKILSVDDEEDIRFSVKSVLEDAGFEVFQASSGKECLDSLSKIQPDLILLDVLMPGLTTKDIVKEIEKRKIKTPVIFLTVVKLSETTRKNLVKGVMIDYVEKPFNNNDLVKRIKKALKI
jgi:DNA-binding response OmpR family regulator